MVVKLAMISIRLTDKEEKIFKEFAKSKNLNLSALIREALLEKIEDEYDIKIYHEYLKNKEDETARPIREIINELGLENEL